MFYRVLEETNWQQFYCFKANLGVFLTFETPKSESLIVFWPSHRYVHNQDWDNAEQVAERHDKSAMSDVLLSRAEVEFEAANYSRFEALMLRCHKPELIVKRYQVRHSSITCTNRKRKRPIKMRSVKWNW